MRLLHTSSLRFVEFAGNTIPKYAILSHTWGAEEVSYEEMRHNPLGNRGKRGFQKIEAFCVEARKNGYEHVWADTCCIDKRSTAELTEAINSMYRWYGNASICYAYLVDVPFIENHERELSSFRRSRWLTRG